MKILLITESLSATGGWATYARNLASGLRQQGHDVAIYSPEEAGVLPALPPPMHVFSHPLRALLLSWRLRSALRKSAPDVVHITAEPYTFLTALWPRALLDRTVLTIHGSYGVRLLQRWSSRCLAKKAFGRIHAFVTVSEYTKNRMAKELACRTTPALAQRFLECTRMIFNASTMPQLPVRREKGSGETRLILLVGPVKPRKGVLEAIEACAVYRDTYRTPFVLRVIGTKDRSPYAQKVDRRIEELSLRNCIPFEGVLTEEKLQEAYRTADLLLLPARTTENTFEGFGLVYIEAASYGVPSIGPEDSGAAEAIDEGRSGYHVRPADGAAIAERMHWVLDERRIRPEDCRAWAATFSVQRMVRVTQGLYANLECHAAERRTEPRHGQGSSAS